MEKNNRKEQDVKTIQSFYQKLHARSKFSSPFKENKDSDIELLNLYKMAYPLQTLSIQILWRTETNLLGSLYSEAVKDDDFRAKVLSVVGDTGSYRHDLCFNYRQTDDGDYLFSNGLLKPEKKSTVGVRSVNSFSSLWNACDESQKQMILKQNVSMGSQADYAFVKESLKNYLMSSLDNGWSSFVPCEVWDGFLKKKNDSKIKYDVFSEDELQRFIPFFEEKFKFKTSDFFRHSARDNVNGFMIIRTIYSKAGEDLNFKEQNLIDNIQASFNDLVRNGVPEYKYDKENDEKHIQFFNLSENILYWVNVKMSLSIKREEPLIFSDVEMETIFEIDRQMGLFKKLTNSDNYIPLSKSGFIFKHMSKNCLMNSKDDFFEAYVNAEDKDLKESLGGILETIPLNDVLKMQENYFLKNPTLNLQIPLVEKMILNKKIEESVNKEDNVTHSSNSFKL